jgi:hypothetical protein
MRKRGFGILRVVEKDAHNFALKNQSGNPGKVVEEGKSDLFCGHYYIAQTQLQDFAEFKSSNFV